MTFLRILVIIFIWFAASRAYLRYKERSLDIKNLIFWIVIWGATLILVFDPKISDDMAVALGLQRGTDTAFFIAIMIIFYLVFRLYIKIDSVDRNLTKLNTSTSKILHMKNNRQNEAEQKNEGKANEN